MAKQSNFTRRSFIRRSAAWSTALACAGIARGASGQTAPRITAPLLDSLKIRVVVDGEHNIFISGDQVPNVKVERTRLQTNANAKRTLQSEWGLSLHLESQKGAETKRFMLDFGYTSPVLNNNLDLLDIDLAKLDALILSHGHLDHFGGLQGFLETHRAKLRPDMKLYVGGEDAFCHRYAKLADGKYVDFGVLDRRMLAQAKIQAVASELPLVIEGHAFTTGAVPRTSVERVLPNSLVGFGERDGAGCKVSAYANQHFSAAELAGEPQADQHLHEHATCFHVKDHGLVIITSCGHGGIINTVNRARQVTGVEKVHALIGGFHLAPASSDYLNQIVAEVKKLDIQYLFPMHCSGHNFIAAAERAMPFSIVACTTGSRFTFGAA